MVLDLGGGVELEALHVDGHLHAELAWFERSSRTLILGDVVTATAWPIFHGHVEPQELQRSLERLIVFVQERDVQTVALSHHSARDAAAFVELAESVLSDLADIRQGVADALQGGEQTLEQVWRTVCGEFGKEPEFRALAMIDAHLRAMVADGSVRLTGPETYALRG